MDRVRCLLLDDPSPDVGELTSRPGVLSVDVIDHDRLHLLAERSMPVAAPSWTALVWTTDEVTTPSASGYPVTLTLDRHPVWGDRLDDYDDAVLMVSMVARPHGLDAGAFIDRYRAHAEVARTYHGFDAYRQTLVTSGTAVLGKGPAAVSEILLADEEAWRDRFYEGDGASEAVGRDVARFLDRAATRSTLVRRFPGSA
jgi:hypothetical protein